MSWFWLNVPLALAFWAIWTGVPLWVVLKHPDTGEEPARTRADVHQRPAMPSPNAPPPADGDRRELAGARS
jgi:hypothetical protein